MVQVPVATYVTSPVALSTEHLVGVDVVKLLVPVPADGVTEIVGILVDRYELKLDPASTAKVRVAKEITKVTALLAVA
jgi:hypothetical protein